MTNVTDSIRSPASRRAGSSSPAGRGDRIDSIAGLLGPSYTASVSSFTFIGEPLFMLWLLLKGRKIALTA